MSWYATLAEARDELKVKATDTTDDDKLMAILEFVSRRIDIETEREFAPREATRPYDAMGLHIDDTHNTLLLDRPFLSVATVTDGRGNALVEGTNYVLRPQYDTPYTQIRRIDRIGWSLYTTDWVDAITVTGVTGYRKNYSAQAADVWVNSGETIPAGGITSSTTQFDVNDVVGVDGLNRTPRFSPGQLIRITTDSTYEFCMVVAATDNDAPTLDTITVVRGVNGTTAISHDAGDAIHVWEPEPNIKRATVIWAKVLYKKRGAIEQTTGEGTAPAVRFPKDIPGEVAPILVQYADPSWGVVGIGTG